MKPKTYFRIICLKNSQNNQYPASSQRHRSVIVSDRGVPLKNRHQSFMQPSIVHLSARLQGDGKEDNKQRKYHERALTLKVNSAQSDTSLLEVQQRKYKSGRDKFILNVQQYFEEKRINLQKQKLTMKNLIGSIDFTPNRKKQKKISRTIKQIIDGNDINEFTPIRLVDLETKKISVQQNRVFLKQDFNLFITKKQDQFSKQKYKPIIDEQQVKLQKLTITNPQNDKDDASKPHQKDIRSLNLFRFQQTADKSRSRKNSNSINISKRQLSMNKGRLERVMFNLQNIKTQQKQFQWSKLNRNRHYSNHTIDP